MKQIEGEPGEEDDDLSEEFENMLKLLGNEKLMRTIAKLTDDKRHDEQKRENARLDGKDEAKVKDEDTDMTQ